jgi:hypothetical protein
MGILWRKEASIIHSTINSVTSKVIALLLKHMHVRMHARARAHTHTHISL